MEPTPNQDNYLDCDPESTVLNPHTKPTEFLLKLSYTEPQFSSSGRSGGIFGAGEGHTLVHYPGNTVGLCSETKNFVNLIVPYKFYTVVSYTCIRLVAQFLDLVIGALQLLPRVWQRVNLPPILLRELRNQQLVHLRPLIRTHCDRIVSLDMFLALFQ